MQACLRKSLRNWQILIAPTRVCWSMGDGNQLSGESAQSPTHCISNPAAIVAATVTRLRPESAMRSFSQHGKSTPLIAGHQASAAGVRCAPEQEPLIFNG